MNAKLQYAYIEDTALRRAAEANLNAKHALAGGVDHGV